MVESAEKRPRFVGNYIRKRRESLGLSQKALGQLFSPPVTTQFISNVERGATPLPPAHIPTLAKALMIAESELKGVLEQEYAAKLSGKLGLENEGSEPSVASKTLLVAAQDHPFLSILSQAYAQASPAHRSAFENACKNMLEMNLGTTKSSSSGNGGGNGQSGTPLS